MDLHLLDDYVAKGLLARDVRGALALYNYTPRCTYDGAWDEVTLQARGLLVDRSTGEVVARPWPKFFNHDEPWADVPAGPPDTVTVKMDGSLGILYREDGRIRWTTRGKLGSPQGAAAEAMWHRDHAGVRVPEAWTVLAEIVHPATRIIVRYDFEALVVLGVRDRFTGADLPFDDVAAWCAAEGLRCVERVPLDFDGARAVAARLDDQREGFVLRWGDHRVKVKSGAYLEVARLLQGFNDRTAADYWFAGVPLPMVLPEETRAWGARVAAELELAAARAEAEVAELLRIDAPDRKAFVQAVGTSHPRFALAMEAYSGKASSARRAVYVERFGGVPRATMTTGAAQAAREGG